MNKYVCIFGPPRSGTSWLGQIFNSSPETFYIYQLFYFNRNKFSPDNNFIKNNLDMLIKHMSVFKGSFIPSDPANLQETQDSIKYLSFEKKNQTDTIVLKHVRYHHMIESFIKEKDAKIIGLIRNPLATINSWLKAPKEFSPHLNPLDEWYAAPTKNSNKQCYEYAGYLNWQRIATNYIKLESLYPKNFKLINYKELLGDQTERSVEDILSFCNLPFTESTKEFIVNSKSKGGSTYSVFRKNKVKDDDWKEELDPKIRDEIINLTQSCDDLDQFLEE